MHLELKNKLAKEEKGRKSTAAALDNAKRQAEGQKVLLRNAEDQLAYSKEKITTLKKKFEVVQKARVQAEKAKEEPEKARDEAEVEASSVLRKPESIYYLPAIRASSFTGYKADTLPEVTNPNKSSPNEVPPSSNSPQKEAEQPRAKGKEAEMTKEVASEATMPPTAPQDFAKDKEAPKMEIVFATLPLLAKGDPKGSYQGPIETAVQQSKAPPHGKIVIKKKYIFV
ncbi:hypothetical protein SO802_002357 [Lithocarpus litseifolius]|uniref:Uncharacterized protein n=1 Tax=Lithocarpus litseifolius TaxID=425828 RepID=A0AAW2DXB6_9ROSI